MAGHFFLQSVLFRTTLWYGQPPHGKKGLWDGPVTLKNADLWQWFLSQQINRTSGMANHHMVKRGPVGRSGNTKERGPVAMVPCHNKK